LNDDEFKLKLNDLELDLISIKHNPDPSIVYNPEKILIRY
jgi:hypothetical protein